MAAAEPPDEGAPDAEVAEVAVAATPAPTAPGDDARGITTATIDPFALWLSFAKSRRAGKVRTAFVSFLERWKEPIDVRADKILDLAAFGKGPNLFLKTPRPKRPDEFPSDLADRIKHDLERQFNLRNLSRFVKTVNRDDPLEFKRKAVEVGKLDFDARAHMKEVYKKIEGITLELGSDAVRAELAWRHKMLEVMQWERYFSKEIRDEWSGAMWRHDPDTNPVGAQGRQTVDKDEAPTDVAPAGSDKPIGDAT